MTKKFSRRDFLSVATASTVSGVVSAGAASALTADAVSNREALKAQTATLHKKRNSLANIKMELNWNFKPFQIS